MCVFPFLFSFLPLHLIHLVVVTIMLSALIPSFSEIKAIRERLFLLAEKMAEERRGLMDLILTVKQASQHATATSFDPTTFPADISGTTRSYTKTFLHLTPGIDMGLCGKTVDPRSTSQSSVTTKGRNGFTMPGMGSRTTDYAGRRSWGTAHATQG